MGNFRFYRRVSIFPGLSVNVSKSGPSLTVGMRGAHVARRSASQAPASTTRRTADTIRGRIRRTSSSRFRRQQTTAHVIAQVIALMVIIGAVAFAIALVGSVAGGK